MPSSRSEWDEKYRLAGEAPPAEPASFVRELLPHLPRGAALDLACGAGRHTLFLAESGRHVTAVDRSGVAIDKLEAAARAARLPVRRISALGKKSRPFPQGIELMEADLEGIELPEESFDLILNIRYLQRPLFPQMCRALRPGGVLLFETYTRAQLEFDGGPRNPAHLLEPDELRTAFPALRLLFYRELRAGQGIASLVAQKPGKRC
jgi:tellurite methyltransferase